MPSEKEISRIRRLIHRITISLDKLTNDEREQVAQALTLIRRHPHRDARHAPRPPEPARPPPGAHRMTTSTPRTAAMTAGRRADTDRRRQRVLTALNNAVNNGEELSVSGIARTTDLDRTYLYRHRDLLEQLHAAQAQPRGTPGVGPTVSRASLQADLLTTQHHCTRIPARAHQLETRLSELLGEQTWRESGLGAPEDIDQLKQQIVSLEQHIVDLRLQLQERDQDLTATRATNHELTTQLNASRQAR
jgi:hypothetical protein